MSSAVSLIARLANKRAILILFAIYVTVFGTILFTLGQLTNISGGNGILDFEPGYTAQRVAEVFGSYGDTGMALYGRIQFLDLFNPALYALVASVFTYLLWKARGPEWLCLMPFLAAIGDYAENITLFLLSRAFPDVPEGLVALSSILSLIKNGLMLIGMAPLVVGLVLLVLRKLRSQQGLICGPKHRPAQIIYSRRYRAVQLRLTSSESRSVGISTVLASDLSSPKASNIPASVSPGLHERSS